MANQERGAVLRHFRTLFHVGTVGNLTDAQLLQRSLARCTHDDLAGTAFAALVERHGPMVYRVCRAILRDEHEAQDAFQATFLVLVRKAGSLSIRDSLGPWLFGVAHRVASAVRRAGERRRAHEARAGLSVVSAWEPSPEPEYGALHDELLRLPARYRQPIVLCYLEGLTHAEAARLLGCPVGTVESRLARGRERLRGRLIRRGLGFSAGALAIQLTRDAAASVVPASLVEATVDAVLRSAGGSLGAGAVPAAIATLTEEVLGAMFLAKVKMIGVLVLSTGLVLAGVGFLARPGSGPAALAGAPEASQAPTTAGSSLEAARQRAAQDATRVAEQLQLRVQELRDQLRKTQDELDNTSAELARARGLLRALDSLPQEPAKVPPASAPQQAAPDLESARSEVALAQSNLARAEDRVEWAARMFQKGYVSIAQKKSEELALQRAKFALEQAQTKLSVLEKYAKEHELPPS